MGSGNTEWNKSQNLKLLLLLVFTCLSSGRNTKSVLRDSFCKRQHELFHDAAGGSAPLLSVRFNDNNSLSDAAVRGSESPNSRRRNSHALFIYGIASRNLCISVIFTTTRKCETLSSTSEKLYHTNNKQTY